MLLLLLIVQPAVFSQSSAKRAQDKAVQAASNAEVKIKAVEDGTKVETSRGKLETLEEDAIAALEAATDAQDSLGNDGIAEPAGLQAKLVALSAHFRAAQKTRGDRYAKGQIIDDDPDEDYDPLRDSPHLKNVEYF